MDCVLGLDTGGTKTLALLVNRQGETVQRLTGPGLDPLAGDGWIGELRRLADALMVRPVAAVLGMTLHGEVAEVSHRQGAVAREVLGPGAVVVNDTQIAHEGAFAGGDGVLILSGTGSMVWARGPLGHVRVGGWGPDIGDEGSAFWIARAALTRAAREMDGRDPRSALLPAIEAATGATSFELMDWVHRVDRAGCAALSRKVAELAEQGIAPAREILADAARALLEQALVARRRAGLAESSPWSFGGGAMAALAGHPVLLNGMARRPDPPRHTPAEGAVIAARALAGW